MLKVFPTCLFAPDGIEADIELRTISGGRALNDDEDLIATDGGGRVFAQFDNAYLDEPEVALAWRAASAYLDGGATPIIVPFCDARHQPTDGRVTVTHSDGTPFDDESEYSQADSDVTLAADAALRATTLYLAITTLPRSLLGGEWLSIDHTTKRHRAYRIKEITAQDATTATVKISPPLREATTAGTIVDFANPRCVMRLDGEMRSPTMLGYAEGSAIRFVEHPAPAGGY